MADPVSSTVMLLRPASTNENEQQATRAARVAGRNGCISDSELLALTATVHRGRQARPQKIEGHPARWTEASAQQP